MELTAQRPEQEAPLRRLQPAWPQLCVTLERRSWGDSRETRRKGGGAVKGRVQGVPGQRTWSAGCSAVNPVFPRWARSRVCTTHSEP